MTTTVRDVTGRQRVFVEPFVLFNSGAAPTSLPGADSDDAFSVHSYASSVEGEQGVVDNALAAAERDGAAVLVTEFGATIDPSLLQWLTVGFDEGIVPWVMWDYHESIIRDSRLPAGLDNVRSLDALAALVRPYPTAVAGTPTHLSFDPDTGAFEFRYATRGPSAVASRRCWSPSSPCRRSNTRAATPPRFEARASRCDLARSTSRCAGTRTHAR